MSKFTLTREEREPVVQYGNRTHPWVFRGYRCGDGSFSVEIYEDYNRREDEGPNYRLMVCIDGDEFRCETKKQRQERWDLINAHQDAYMDKYGHPADENDPKAMAEATELQNELLRKADEKYMTLDPTFSVWAWVRECLKRWEAIRLLVTPQTSYF